MYQKNKQDEEEDPLDAFMAGIENEVATILCNSLVFLGLEQGAASSISDL